MCLLIILSQEFRSTYPEVEWKLAEGRISSQEAVATKRHSTLRCLEFLRYQVTGSRRWAKPRLPREQVSIEEILEGLTVDAYAELLEGWRLVPNRFF